MNINIGDIIEVLGPTESTQEDWPSSLDIYIGLQLKVFDTTSDNGVYIESEANEKVNEPLLSGEYKLVKAGPNSVGEWDK